MAILKKGRFNVTRKEIEKDYSVDSGVIQSPGKFEAEMLYVPYFWDKALNGLAEEDENGDFIFDVGDEDRKEFPELKDVVSISLWSDENGFVYCEVVEKDA